MTARAICLTILLALISPALTLISPTLCMASGVAVLLSREIPPYISMVEGLERQLGSNPVDRFFLDKKNQPYSLGGGGGELNPEQYDVLVAVGPGALRYLRDRVRQTPLGPDRASQAPLDQSRARQVPLVFGMVLNPQKILTDPEVPSCGVTLNLPIEAQFTAMLNHFPDMSRLGVLFDPVNNQAWYEAAVQVASSLEIELVPLQVQRDSSRLTLLGNFSDLDAILFIPDRTIISKAVIQYVIKQAVLQRTPVVGYNQFFYDSGSTLAFIINYAKVGRQVAAQVEAILAGGSCAGQVPPVFETRINSGVWQALQLGNKGGGR